MTSQALKLMKIILKKFSIFNHKQMKKILFIAFVSLIIIACKQIPKKNITTTEAPAPQKEWLDLFDGVSFTDGINSTVLK